MRKFTFTEEELKMSGNRLNDMELKVSFLKML